MPDQAEDIRGPESFAVNAFNDWVRTVNQVMMDQMAAVSTIYAEALSSQQYSLESWSADVARLWRTGASGLAELATFPYRARSLRGDQVPTLVFVLDAQAELQDPKFVVDREIRLTRPIADPSSVKCTPLRELGSGKSLPAGLLRATVEPNSSRVEVSLQVPKGAEPIPKGHYAAAVYGDEVGGDKHPLCLVHVIRLGA